MERVRQYPGQERQVWEYFQKNPAAKAELRAPILEEKTVDHLLERVNVLEQQTSREELFRDEDEAKADETAGA
jgi:trigger factor